MLARKKEKERKTILNLGWSEIRKTKSKMKKQNLNSKNFQNLYFA